MKPDSTFSKRTVTKRAGVGPPAIPKAVSDIGKDIMAGMGELKRQMGTAVQTVKSGYQKVRSFMR